MPTIRGVIRRGVNVQSLKKFIYSQGASRNVVLMDWMAFFAENKIELDKTARRFMAVDKESNVTLTVTNGPSAVEHVYVQTPNHPKDASLGTRAIRTCKQVLLESVDVEGIEVGESIVLMRWGVVKITKVDGTVLEGEYDPDGDFKAAKRKLSWMADVSGNTPAILTEFDHLVTKDKLDEEDDWKAFVNQNTMATTEVIGDAGLKTLQEHDVIQLERRGFYRVDRPYINSDKPMVLYMIPEGKKKSMSGMQGKLAHH
jgi:glutamyl-tRNA synthetase